MISLDTENTGIDHFHGCQPYFVTMCNDDRTQTHYEWDINPVTRQPIIPKADIRAIKDRLILLGGWSTFSEDVSSHHRIVLQNSKYDAHALATIGINYFPWKMVDDTLTASHILASNQAHDLTSLALLYLSIDIKPYEDALETACKETRNIVRHYRRKEPDHPIARWCIAEPGLPSMPSLKSSSSAKVERGGESERSWKADGWLPRALAKELKMAKGHPWWTVLRDYANADSAVTLALWPVLKAELLKRGLWNIYKHRVRLMEMSYRMEKSGITVSLKRLEEQESEFKTRSDECKEVCKSIARGYDVNLVLPKKGLNNSLRDFCFGDKGLALPTVKETPGGAASLDKYAVETYFLTLEPDSDQLIFLTNLMDSRKMDTGLTFLGSYRKYGIPCGDGWLKLHPQANPCGTDTTRFSMSNPNGQQISKQEKINLRKAFGPMPGRVWYSADAKNIELRIPAYRSGEPDMIDLFERSKEPPFYGSSHLLNFSIIYPDIWEKELREVGLEKVGAHIKSKYDGSWYTYGKNTGLGIQYRAGRATADKAAHRLGSYDKIMGRFGKLHGSGGLNERLVRFARQYGYVETFPSKGIDPNRGYPLMVSRNEYGKVLDTTPLNYVVQGSAGEWMAQALLRCYDQLDAWEQEDGFDGFITLTVHDEIVFDFPLDDGSHGWRLEKLRSLMEQGGDDIDVPTPVSIERHEVSWAVGVEV